MANQSSANQPALSRLDQLTAAVNEFFDRTFRRNYKSVIRLMEAAGFLPEIVFYISDLSKTVRFSWRRGLREADGPPDISLTSENLLFLFRNDFGTDTLYVNARFQASDAGRNKLLLAFAVPLLNNTGRFVRFSIARELADPAFLKEGLRAVGMLR